MVSKSFVKWINSTQKNSPWYYIVKDDAAVERAREEADLLPKTDEEKNEEELKSFEKLQQYASSSN